MKNSVVEAPPLVLNELKSTESPFELPLQFELTLLGQGVYVIVVAQTHVIPTTAPCETCAIAPPPMDVGYRRDESTPGLSGANVPIGFGAGAGVGLHADDGPESFDCT